MSSNFQLSFKKSSGNLHVSPSGDFDGSSAGELIHLLGEHYNGRGRVFINTRKLRRISPFGCSTFQCRLAQCRVPADRLYFKGEKGFELAPEGSRVIVASPKGRCRCNGNCKDCTCNSGGRRRPKRKGEISHGSSQS